MKLKNCVLCGRSAHTFSKGEKLEKRYYVSCGRTDCDARTAAYPNEYRAGQAWNRTFSVNVFPINCSPLGKRIRKEMVE